MLKRILRAMSHRNFPEFIKLAIYNLVYYLKELSPQAISAARKERQFDRRYGIETSGIKEIGALDVPLELARHAVRYQPSDPYSFNKLISTLNIDFKQFVFLDYGSGKGRILLLASHYPFKQIIGVEFSRKLHEIAKRNIACYSAPERCCYQIDSVCCNAIDYTPPLEPLVCYFYNPFDEIVMQQVVSKLEASLRTTRRLMYVLYLDPRHRHLFEASEAWMTIQANSNYAIYMAKTANPSTEKFEI